MYSPGSPRSRSHSARSRRVSVTAPSPIITTPNFSFTDSFTHSDEEQYLLNGFVDSTNDDFEIGATSTAQTTFNAVNSLVGVGILSLPYALKQSGWILGCVLLVFLLCVTNYTAKLLKRCMLFRPGTRGYPDIGEVAFGHIGRVVISVCFFFELFTACSMYLILAADHLMLLFPNDEYPGWSETKFVLISLAVVLPTASTNKLHYISYLSLIGIFSSFWILGIVVYEGVVGEVASFEEPIESELWTNFNSSMITYGLIMVGFAGHAVLPSFYEAMSHPSQYNIMVDITWAILGLIYGGLAVCGYYIYGYSCADEITKTLFAKDKQVISTITFWLIVLNPLTKFALTINPVALSLEEIVDRKFENPQSMMCRITHVLIRWLLSGMAAVIAISVPNFGRVVGFIGSVFSFSVSILFPCVCYLKIYWKEIGLFSKIINITLALCAVVMGVFGTIGTILSHEPPH